MDFKVRHVFACSAEELWAMVWDPRYQAEVDRRAKLGRELLEDRKRGQERLLKLRFVPDRTLPPALARAAGTDSLAYTQEQTWDMRRMSMIWRVIPDAMPDRIRSSGDFKVLAKGPATCERVITGTVKATIPVLGGRVEKSVVDDIVQGYERTAELTTWWIENELRK